MEKVKLTQAEILDKLLNAGANTPEVEITINRIGLTFRLKALREDTIEKLQDRYTRVTKSRGVETKELEKDKYYRALIVESTIAIGGDPEVTWNSDHLKSAYKAKDGEHVVKRILLSGEIIQVVDKVLEISGHYDVAEEASELGNESPNED